MKIYFVIISVILSLLSGCSKMTADEYLSQAKNQLNEQQYTKAVISLKNAIAQDSRNTEARMMLARTYLQLGEGLNAVKELKRATSLRVNPANLASDMVESLFLAQDFQAAIDYVDELMPVTKSKQLEKFAFYQAWSLTETGNLSDAIDLLSEDFWKDDNQYTLAAEYLRAFVTENQKEIDEIATIIESRDTIFVDSYWLIGKVSYVVGDFERASKALANYERQKPQFLPAKLLLTKSLMQSGDVEKAQGIMDELLTINPDEPVTNLLAATLAFQKREYQQSFDYAVATMQISGANPQSQLLAGVSAYFNKDYKSAYFYLDPIEPLLSEGHTARRAYLATLVRLKETEKAFKLLSNESMQDQQASILLDTAGIQLINQGDLEEGKALIAKSATLSTAEESGYFRGIAKLMTGNSEGLDILYKLAETEPDNPIINLSISSALMSSGQYENAKVYLAKVAGNEKVIEAALQLEAKIAFKQQDFETVNQLYTRLLESDQGNEQANIYFAQQALNDGSPKQAIAHTQNVLEQEPANLSALIYSIAAYQQLGDLSAAIEILHVATQSDKASYKVQLLLAETLFRERLYTDALSELDSLYANYQQQALRFWQLYAAAVKQQRPTDYMGILSQWINAYPEHSEALYRYAEYHMANRDLAKAELFINKGLAKNPNDYALQLQYGDWLVETKQLEQARIHLARLELPTEYQLAKSGIEGKLDYFSQRYQAALPKVKAFYTHTPTIQYAMLLRAIYVKLEKYDEAIHLLDYHVEQFPEDNLVRLLLANEMIRLDPERAIELYEHSLQYAPESLTALKALTKLCWQHEKPDDAFDYANRWLVLSEEDPTALNFVGKIMLSQTPSKLAVKRLRQAYEALPNNTQFAIDYARGLVEIGDNRQAASVLDGIKNPLPAFKSQIEQLKTSLN